MNNKQPKTKKNKGKAARGGGSRGAPAEQTAAMDLVGTCPVMGPVEAEVHRRAVDASRAYRKNMATAKALRGEQLDAPVAAPPVKGFNGLAALRRRSHEDDDDSFDAGKNDKIEAVTAVDIAVRLLLARQIDRRDGLAGAIRTAAPVVIIDVPDPDVLGRIERVWKDVVLPPAAICAKFSGGGTLRHGQYDAVFVVAKMPAKPKDADDMRRTALDALSIAVPVFAFSPRAEAHLPAELLLAATDRIAIPSLDATAIVRTIEVVTATKCRRTPDAATVAHTGLSELAIAVRFDRKPADCLLRLTDLAAGKTAPRKSRDLRLDQLHGMDAAVTWAHAAIADIAAWRRNEISWSLATTSAALNGPAGTGKTTFALVFSQAAKLPIVTASLSGWQASGEGHLGHLLRAMRQDFEKARNLAATHGGCILFIDEFDSFPNRGKLTHSHADYQIEVVNAMLELIDGLGEKEGLVFIAACNDIRRCDPALVRAGRLNPVIEIGLPGLSDLEKMFRVRLGGDLENADLTEICELSLGGVGADVERIVADARRVARNDGGRPLSLGDLSGVVKGADDRPELLRRRAAVHEAGHILLDVLFNGAAGIHATITPSQGTGGRVTRTERAEVAGTYDDYFRRLQVLLAGRTAEALLLSQARVRTHYSHQMTAAARLMAPMKFLMFRSKRVAMRRQSLKRQNMRSTTLRCL
ncbi:ATP-binding protein [Tardiphaga sp. vice352]|nr:ATP-binding protein [Tardiphaga sp. vice352]